MYIVSLVTKNGIVQMTPFMTLRVTPPPTSILSLEEVHLACSSESPPKSFSALRCEDGKFREQKSF